MLLHHRSSAAASGRLCPASGHGALALPAAGPASQTTAGPRPSAAAGPAAAPCHILTSQQRWSATAQSRSAHLSCAKPVYNTWSCLLGSFFIFTCSSSSFYCNIRTVMNIVRCLLLPSLLSPHTCSLGELRPTPLEGLQCTLRLCSALACALLVLW